jgi:hypothetical protein
MAKHKLVIEIDDEQHTVAVDHDGKQYLLESLALIGGNAVTKELFLQMFGASADAAWAYGQGFRLSRTPEAPEGLNNFYKQCAAHVCNIIDPAAFRNEVGAEEILNMWECTDQSKWFGQDSEDVLADKEKSEARKKAVSRAMAGPDAPIDPKKWS